MQKRVGIESGNGSRANDTNAWTESELEVSYEEYFVEHDVSTADARAAAIALRLDDSKCQHRTGIS